MGDVSWAIENIVTHQLAPEFRESVRLGLRAQVFLPRRGERALGVQQIPVRSLLPPPRQITVLLGGALGNLAILDIRRDGAHRSKLTPLRLDAALRAALRRRDCVCTIRKGMVIGR